MTDPVSRPRLPLAAALAALVACGSRPAPSTADTGVGDGTPVLWRVYHDALAGAKYVDLTHTITPNVPVWPGFGHPTFGQTVSGCLGSTNGVS